jgi:hypothetical protein
MTIQEYTCSKRFPATTQKGLHAKGQLLFDARCYEQLTKFIEQGGMLDYRQWKRWKELHEKIKHHARLTRELSQGK